jgi:hypothetical protein
MGEDDITASRMRRADFFSWQDDSKMSGAREKMTLPGFELEPEAPEDDVFTE